MVRISFAEHFADSTGVSPSFGEVDVGQNLSEKFLRAKMGVLIHFLEYEICPFTQGWLIDREMMLASGIIRSHGSFDL